MKLNRTLLIRILIFLAGWENEKNTRLATTLLCHTRKTNFLATAIQGKFWLITTWVLWSVCFSICNGEFVLTKVIAKIWEHGDIFITKSNKTKHKWPDDQTGCKQTSLSLLIFIVTNWADGRQSENNKTREIHSKQGTTGSLAKTKSTSIYTKGSD